MRQYLDDIGLAELWRRIRNRSIPIKSISNEEYEELEEEAKQLDVLYVVASVGEGQSARLVYKGRPIGDSNSVNFKFGDTLVEKNGIVDVALPVKDANKDVYDSLSPEEKTGLYVVDDPAAMPTDITTTFKINEEGYLVASQDDGETVSEVVLGKVVGKDGDPGSPGKDATINGQNVLTISAGNGIGVSISGSILTIQAIHRYVPNLLDNWDFRNPINQRGLTNYTADANRYSIDRWKLTSGTLVVGTGFITLNGTITQTIENGPLSNAGVRCYALTEGYDRINGSYSSSGIATITTSSPTNLIGAKLEIGKYDTLRDPITGYMDPPPNYAEMLARCQRYQVELIYASRIYSQIGLITGTGRNSGYMFCPLPVSLQEAATIYTSMAGQLVATSTGNSTGTNVLTITSVNSSTSYGSNNGIMVSCNYDKESVEGQFYLVESKEKNSSFLIETRY